MALEYGEKEVIRFMYDKQTKKIVIQFKQQILEDGIHKDYIFPQVITSRPEDFEPTLERLLPMITRQALESEGTAIMTETWAKEKEKRIKAKG